MRSVIRAAVPLALVAGLVTVSPAAAAGSTPAKAHAAGGDVTALVYPSIVQVRIDRAERALQRATKQIEADLPDKAAINLKVVRRQMAAAWRGAKYVIRTTPPPPASEDRVRARASAEIPAGATWAGPADTAFRVLTLHHDMASGVAQLIDGAHGTGLNALSTTLFLTLDRRDKAVKDIVALAPPAPPAEEARVRARASQEDAVVPTFDTVMPNLVPQLDDELQAIQGTLTDATDLTVGGKNLLTKAAAQITATKTFVNTTWPPVPAAD